MAKEYSWEQASSYLPPQREGFGWPILIAVVVALVIHLMLLIYFGSHFIKLPVAEPQEWVSKPVNMSEIQTELEEDAEEPVEEAFEKPEIDGELIDSTEDAQFDLKDAEIDFDTQIEDPLLPEVKIEQPALIGEEDSDIPEPVVGNDSNAEIPEAGKIENLFPEAANGQIVIDDGSPLADVIDPDAVISELGKKQGAGGNSEVGVIKGYTGLDEYAKMSPGQLQENKASIGSDLLFAYNESKENSFYGWIMQTSFQKDAEAVQKRLQNGGSLTGPQKSKWQLDANTGKLVNDDGGNPSSQLTDLFDSNWNNRIELPGETNAQELIALENFGVTKGGQWLSNLGEKSLGWLSNSSGKILGFFGLIIGFAMIPIYLYYFLKESQGIKDGWTDYVPLRASHFKDEVVKTLREINGYLISFFRGQVLVAFIDGILVGIALTVFGLPYGLLIGVFMAFLGIIPYIGNILCLIPACIIAYFHGASEPFGLPQWWYVTGVLAIFIVVQQINSLVTAPKIVGDSVGLHPMTVIFSMLFWSLILGGFLGALLAVPMTAAVKVLFRRYVWDRQTPETAG
ncbi:AI-2E family transporter [Akkermansiaceae bacterium]|nr:AI-2E family transporter [Akkermansiaceae bacterium]